MNIKHPPGRYVTGTADIIWPSISYEEAFDSYTNRLSELIFGSLLASYILGFVGFGINVVGSNSAFEPLAHLFVSFKLFQVFQYLLISATFAYLTAAYYVIYHNSILTMPQIPTHKLRTDFGIALMQAVLFCQRALKTSQEWANQNQPL